MQITNACDSDTPFQHICVELYRSKQQMQVKYAVKNIGKEGPICQNVEKIFTSARMGAGRDGISGATRPPAGPSTARFMPAAIGSAAQNGRNAWMLVKKRR